MVVVGAGIAGLAAAYELRARGTRFRVLEARPRAGGLILTEHTDGFTIDAGPDSLLVQKPAAIALCDELGLSARLVPTLPPRTGYILRAGTLYPLPQASVLGIPTRLLPLVSNGLLSAPAKLRMMMDLVLPARTSADGADSDDESIGSFFRRRFGAEAVTYVAEPLLAGIHSGNVERLSMRALFPRLLDAERDYGSVIRGLRRAGRAGRVAADEGPFRSLLGGIGELVAALVPALPEGGLRYNSRVQAVEASPGNLASLGSPSSFSHRDQTDQRGQRPYTVCLDGGGTVRAGALILAVPAYAAADLLAPLDAELAALCRSVGYTSTAAVVLSYARSAVRHPLRGTGFLVPRAERQYTITAASWVSSKWPGRAPEGQVLLRAFIGGARDPGALGRSDRELVHQAHADLAASLRIDGPPGLTRVYRWERANPQHEIGHLDRLAAIERRLERWPGLYLTGSGFRGVGIPDCLADGRSVAVAATRTLAGSQPDS